MDDNIQRRTFSAREICMHASDFQTWHRFVRRREFEMVMEAFPLGTRFRNALELGASDGGQSETIARFCDRLTCTEMNERGNEIISRFEARALPNVTFQILDARDLSTFGEGLFDFIFSSNVLEHVDGVNRCLAECRRVLAPNGVMVHTMPTRQWKFWNTLVGLLLKRQFTEIHGITSSHWSEWKAFGVKSWRRVLESANFEVFNLVGLPFYFGHGPRPIWLIRLGNQLRWNATIAYYVRRI